MSTRVDRHAALLEDIEAGPAELGAVLAAQGEAIPDIPLGALARPAWRMVVVGGEALEAGVNVPLPESALDDPVVRTLVQPAVADVLAAELWGRTVAAAVGEA